MPPSFPNGCHVAEVEIDPATGATEIVNYVAVGDCGNVLDDTIVEAQIHGGVAQGIGQALTEDTIYDTGGQLVSGTFMDYAVPRADTDAGDDGRASRRSPAAPIRSARKAPARPAPPPLRRR